MVGLYDIVVASSSPPVRIVDFASGDGANSLCVRDLDTDKEIEVCCFDISPVALERVAEIDLPDNVLVTTCRADVEDLPQTPPEVSVFLLCGILEYIAEEKVVPLLELAADALLPGGVLWVKTLVDGPGVWKPPSELPRPQQIYVDALRAVGSLEMIFHRSYRMEDCHDIGRGYKEEHVHYVLRALLVKKPADQHYVSRIKEVAL